MLDECIVNGYEKWIILVILCQKEGKNDHIFHNACLTYIIKYYDDEHFANGKDRIFNNIIHKDNCPTQYK